MNFCRMAYACCAPAVVLVGLAAGCGKQSAVPEGETADSRWETRTPSPDAAGREPHMTADEMREALGANTDAHFQRAGHHFTGAMLANTGVETLQPLAGQPIKMLDLSRNDISDLSPLKGMPLEQLGLFETNVSDISPLQGAPLQLLDLTNTAVADIRPVATMKQLKVLALEGAKVANIAPLKDLELDKLYLNKCPVEDLTPLAGKSLAELNLCETNVADLSALAGMQIGTLWLRDTKISDLSPIRDVPLVSLDVQGSAVTDLSPIAGMTSLQRLNIAETGITDLRPLANLSLTRLIFTPSRITEGLDVARNMSSLRELDVQFEGTEAPMSPAEFWDRFDRGAFQEAAPEGK